MEVLPVDVITSCTALCSSHTNAAATVIYELFDEKQLTTSEWMYALASTPKFALLKQNFGTALKHIQSGDLPSAQSMLENIFALHSEAKADDTNEPMVLPQAIIRRYAIM